MTAITLARELAKQARVVLVDLALGAPNLSVIAVDPGAPGIADLVRGTASFGEIITRDRYSRVHLVMAGRAAAIRRRRWRRSGCRSRSRRWRAATTTW